VPGSIPNGLYVCDRKSNAQNEPASTVETNVQNDGAAPMAALSEGAVMTQKTPSLMHQLSSREKMVYSLYAKGRAVTPLSVEYSLPVGHEFLEAAGAEGVGACPDTDPRLFRIDVIEKYEDHIFLIEVKTNADLKAYGQLMAYSTLYTMHYKPSVPVVPLLVFENASQITLGVMLQEEIPIFPVSIDNALAKPMDTTPKI